MSELFNQAPILDLYAPLNHKAIMGRVTTGPFFSAPSWVGTQHQRRLNAYQLLDAYDKNNARYFLGAEATEADKAGMREFGDAGALVEAVVAALLGESQEISVSGAEDFDPNLPEDATLEQVAENNQAFHATERKKSLDQWAADERWLIKINGAEHKASRLGDCVYELAWSERRKRPRLRTYDPGFYFPVLQTDEEYPNRIHLAWEVDAPEKSNKLKVRRITYELGPIQAPENEDGSSIYDLASESFVDPPNARLVDGVWVRDLPWKTEPTNLTCYVTDGTWELELNRATVDDLTNNSAVWTLSEDGLPMRRLDLMVDFIPVVHIPNTAEEEEHFGSSVLLRVAQLLDSLNASDSDLESTASTSGTPAIGLEGAADAPSSVESANWGPGAVIRNPNGTIKLLHTADALKPLSDYSDALRELLSVNARVPSSAMGRVKNTGTESGIHLSLSWGPLRSMVAGMRLVRHEKYALLLKFVQRFLMLDGQIPKEEGILDAQLIFGNFLPTDLSAAITNVTTLLSKHAISQRTGLTMLMEAGLPIEDAGAELLRIEAEVRRSKALEDPAGFLQALGDPEVLSEILGVAVAPVETSLPPAELGLEKAE